MDKVIVKINKKQKIIYKLLNILKRISNYVIVGIALCIVLLLNQHNNKINILSIIFQTMFICGIFSVLKNKLLKSIFAFFIIFPLFTFLAYNSYPSVSIIMSMFSTSFHESLSFIIFNFNKILLVAILFIALIFLPTPENKKLNYAFLLIGFLYTISPALIALNDKIAPKYIRRCLARGMSKRSAVMEYVLVRKVKHNFPEIMTFRGIYDTINFFERIKQCKNSSWHNVKIIKNPPPHSCNRTRRICKSRSSWTVWIQKRHNSFIGFN